MKYLSILILLVFGFYGFSQEYAFKADLMPVSKTGYYKIVLSPEIISKLNSQFSDIRIYNQDIEVPYIFGQDKRVEEKELFNTYEIIEKQHIKKWGYTRIVIHNPEKSAINNIVLRIKNADVRKHLKLNASYDKKNWYVLKDNYDYNSIENSENTSEIRVLNFPLSDYEYYELLIYDVFDKPINIIEAGYYNRTFENGKFFKIENIPVQIRDTLKETIISLALQGNYVDKMVLNIVAPKYYYREAELFVKRTKVQKKRSYHYEQTIGSFKLISNSNNEFSLNNASYNTLYVRIKNNDDLPLQIKNVEFFQLKKYLIAQLDTDKKYVLKFSNKEALKPIYDLKYFADSIPDSLPQVTPKKIEPIKQINKTEQEGNFNIKSYWLWICIILVAGLLFFISVKMVKEREIN